MCGCRLAVGVVLALSLLPRTRAAAEAPAVAARRHFEEGTKLYNVGEFLQAAKEYTAAYKALPDSVILYNIAQAYRLGSDYQQALFFYRSYLRNVPNAINRPEVEERIRHLEEQIATGGPPTREPKPPPLPMPPATGTMAPATTPAVTPPAGKTEWIAPPSQVERARAPARLRSPAWRKWWVWTLVGAAAAGAAVGIGLGVGLHSDPHTHFGATTVQF
jgi:tetratricopeptide (TPR) repeat protein